MNIAPSDQEFPTVAFPRGCNFKQDSREKDILNARGPAIEERMITGGYFQVTEDIVSLSLAGR